MRAREVYLDTSAIVAVFIDFDPHHLRISQVLDAQPCILSVSDFGTLEFVSALSRLIRTSRVGEPAARSILAKFDVWRGGSTRHVKLDPEDVALAERFIRRLDLTLRAPDALHLAIAGRTGASLMTFDRQMIGCARLLKIELTEDDADASSGG